MDKLCFRSGFVPKMAKKQPFLDILHNKMRKIRENFYIYFFINFLNPLDFATFLMYNVLA